MDSLILSFTPDQYDTYLKVRNSDIVELNFDPTLPKISSYSYDLIKSEIQSIMGQCNSLLNLRNNSKSFFSSFSSKQMNELISAYYQLVSSVAKSRKVLYTEAIQLVETIKQIDCAYSELCIKYAKFLPYRAALYENEEYSTQIEQIDNIFKENISTLENLKEKEIAKLSTINNICDIFIPDFFEDTKKASDSPKFNKFHEHAFFNAIRSFTEKLKNI